MKAQAFTMNIDAICLQGYFIQLLNNTLSSIFISAKNHRLGSGGIFSETITLRYLKRKMKTYHMSAQEAREMLHKRRVLHASPGIFCRDSLGCIQNKL